MDVERADLRRDGEEGSRAPKKRARVEGCGGPGLSSRDAGWNDDARDRPPPRRPRRGGPPKDPPRSDDANRGGGYHIRGEASAASAVPTAADVAGGGRRRGTSSDHAPHDGGVRRGRSPPEASGSDGGDWWDRKPAAVPESARGAPVGGSDPDLSDDGRASPASPAAVAGGRLARVDSYPTPPTPASDGGGTPGLAASGPVMPAPGVPPTWSPASPPGPEPAPSRPPPSVVSVVRRRRTGGGGGQRRGAAPRSLGGGDGGGGLPPPEASARGRAARAAARAASCGNGGVGPDGLEDSPISSRPSGAGSDRRLLRRHASSDVSSADSMAAVAAATAGDDPPAERGPGRAPARAYAAPAPPGEGQDEADDPPAGVPEATAARCSSCRRSGQRRGDEHPSHRSQPERQQLPNEQHPPPLPRPGIGVHPHRDRHISAPASLPSSSPAPAPPASAATISPVALEGRDRNTPLHAAIRDDDVAAALDLIGRGRAGGGASLTNIPNARGVTPLMLAAQRGRADVAEALLEAGADPLAASHTGATALIQASHFGHAQVVDLLLGGGGAAVAVRAQVERANYKSTTALMRAAQEGHTSVVSLLLRRGRADPNRTNAQRMTALMLASQRGHTPTVRELLRYGADPDLTSSQDSTALMLACKRDHVGAARALVGAGCELALRDGRGRTAADTAGRRGCRELTDGVLTGEAQVGLMRAEARRRRCEAVAEVWTLLQRERARVVAAEGVGCTIHQVASDLRGHPAFRRGGSSPSRSALVRAMTLPAPMMELIALFLPLPDVWDARMSALVKRCHVDPDSAIASVLDLMDEVLDAGGFVEACGEAGARPPASFVTWADWKAWGNFCDCHPPNSVPGVAIAEMADPSQDGPGERARSSSSPPPPRRPMASTLRLRRSANLLGVLAHDPAPLARTLAGPPYRMPTNLIRRLGTASDVQSLVRRMGSRGVRFEVGVAVEMVMLASQAILWYRSYRAED